jgi:hypothetical protein
VGEPALQHLFDRKINGTSAARILLLGALLGIAIPASTQAATPDPKAEVAAFFEARVADWVGGPEVVNAIKAQNERHAGLQQADIDALDLKWRAEIASDDNHRPFVAEIMDNELSGFLKARQRAADWMIVEIIVMDGRGLNVGVSTPTSDYWQGDEDKFQKTFLQPEAGLFIDDIEYEPDTHLVLSQANSAIIDPDTGEPIGAITVSLNLNKL